MTIDTAVARETDLVLGEALRFAFDPVCPRLVCVQASATDALMGDEASAAPAFEIGRVGSETLWSGKDHPEVTADYCLSREGDTLRYAATVRWAGAMAVQLEIYFTLRGTTLQIGYRDVHEEPGYQLLAVRLPAVATVLDCQTGARMIATVNGGRLIDPATTPDFETHAWPGWNWHVYATAVYHDRMMAVLEMPCIDDHFFHGVAETRDPLPPFVLNGAGQALRLRQRSHGSGGGTESRGKTPEAQARKAAIWPVFAHRAPSPKPELRFVLHEQSHCTVTYQPAPADRPMHWMDAARLLRSRLSFRVPQEHRNLFSYGVYNDVPGFAPEERVRFSQVLEVIQKVHHLTDGITQNVTLCGWQHFGHDTGYPDVDAINPALGTEADLHQLIAQAKAFGAAIGTHDNYQCAYKHSPAWDPEIVCRDANGELMRGGIWAGGQQYILHYYNYVIRGHGQALERVKRTYDRFAFSGTCYFDEMNVWLAKRDYNPARPASGQQCMEGMIALIRTMNQRGILLMSEGFAGPLAGHLSHGCVFQEGEYDRLPHGRKIPFVHAVYHGHATYAGDAGPDGSPLVLLALFNGRTTGGHLAPDNVQKRLPAMYYLVHLPHLLLREREVEAVEEVGTTIRIHYGRDPRFPEAQGDTLVEVDFDADRYQVIVDGRLMARDYGTLVPSPRAGHWLAFAQRDGELVYPAPAGWPDDAAVEAVCLTEAGPGQPMPCRLSGGVLRVQVQGGVPVRIGRTA